ncbi:MULTISPECIES: MSMEG_0565 family glycosyltransferase [unclassified Rhodococcus (in: high G+C Gram-positive bacteria)]|uniref:MSMEG_0565 family glycosyltransferase n=1 Tax=unclassified Rhodococcus (in: high G+C Gram-positive bacteria) TaxID=192944 RepID=UPI00163A04A4|nr:MULTISPECIES: MSMEG_0565 family glycosyltransferase [unclassified Rhodococcus (in: high G+C Gram-positive bacteria)]MBC2638166.1 MSMEG_0565 family glycosyltransferase [Rhodococcus sp. 3A]MBC2897091.1 MSMEG_0565 family glycosyltransferase [Rhodococcus sp. 4CII]
MRIALLTYSTKPRGGVVHTLALAEALARQGAEVTVWSLGRGGDGAFFRRVDPAVTVRVVPFAAIEGENVGDRILRSIAVLRGAFTPDAYDIVHAQDCISANAVGRCIRTIHHLDQFTTPALAACHERAVVEPYARICVSEAVAAEVHTRWGLDPTVIPNGVDAARFEKAVRDDAGRRRWAEKLGDYVLAVGGIEPRKGSIDLVEAYALLRRDRPDLKLVFAGGETLFDYRGYRDDFDARCTQLDVRPTILGTVDDDALPSLVAQATVFAFLSTKEGFGLAAMEALAAGVPVVARDLPVLREVFGSTVRFASTHQQMADALRRPGDADQVYRGRALARGHSWDDTASAHLKFYAEMGH